MLSVQTKFHEISSVQARIVSPIGGTTCRCIFEIQRRPSNPEIPQMLSRMAKLSFDVLCRNLEAKPRVALLTADQTSACRPRLSNPFIFALSNPAPTYRASVRNKNSRRNSFIYRWLLFLARRRTDSPDRAVKLGQSPVRKASSQLYNSNAISYLQHSAVMS